MDLLHEILLSREERVKKQNELIDEYKSSLISFTLNIPGSIKDSPLNRKIHNVGMEEILHLLNNKELKIVYKELIYKKTGPEGYVCVETDPFDLKIYAIEVEEEHKLGRLFDFDIIDKDKRSINREIMNYPSRKCLLCNNKALECKRMQNHTINQLIDEINRLSFEYFQSSLK